MAEPLELGGLVEEMEQPFLTVQLVVFLMALAAAVLKADLLVLENLV